jgi:hypothetical protein
MEYYAKMTGPHKGGKKIFVEIWKTENIDGITYDEKACERSFFTMTFAKNWAQTKMMKLIMKNEMKYFFIKDEDVIRKELS